MAVLSSFVITAIRYIITGLVCVLCAFGGVKLRQAVNKKKESEE